MNKHLLAVALTGIVAISANSFAQTTATTDPVGFVSVTAQAQSDAILAVPLNRTPEFKGVIDSISSNIITVSGTPGWAANQFVQSLPGQPKTYAVLIATGVKEGLIAKVTQNSTNTLTIQVESGDDLSGVKTEAVDGQGNGDHIDVMPYWTPAALIPNPPDGTEIYNYFNPATGNPGNGINLAPSVLFVFDAGSGTWVDQITEDEVSHVPMRFGSAFLMRNNSGSVFQLSFVGSVPMAAHRFLLKTLLSNVDQDLRIGYLSPIPETVSSVGFPAAAGDQLFVYNNAAAGKNKSPAKILVYDGADWLDGITENPENNYPLNPGDGFIFRKFRTGSPSVAVWQDVQSYLNP